MGFKSTVVCNVCGRQRQDSNHWLVVVRNTRRPFNDPIPQLSIMPAHAGFLDENNARTFENLQHICGSECLHKVIDKFRIEVMGE